MINERIVEIYLPVIIDGRETDYIISDKGNIKNKITGKTLKQSTNANGYKFVGLYVSTGNVKFKRVHILVAEAFIPNPENKPTVNHKDGNKFNNCYENLEWATHREQNIHAYKIGLMKPRKGLDSHYTKIDEETVHNICRLLSQGKSLVNISKELNVSYSIVKHILLKHSWVDISSLYDIDINKIEKGNSSSNTKLAKITENEVFEILSLYDSGKSYKEITKEMNNIVSRYTVSDICNGRTWKSTKIKYEKNKEKGSTTSHMT